MLGSMGEVARAVPEHLGHAQALGLAVGAWALWLVVIVLGLGRVLGALIHKLIELCLVLAFAQTLQKSFEVVLLFFQAAKRLGFVAVKCHVARRFECSVPARIIGDIVAVAFAFEHLFAPDHVEKKCEAGGPEKDERQDHCGDPRALAALIKPGFCLARPGCDGAHLGAPMLFEMNVNAFHMNRDAHSIARLQGQM